MRLDKRITAAFALGFSLVQGAFTQSARMSENVSASRPCQSANPTSSSTESKKIQSTVIVEVRISKSGVVQVVRVLSGPPTLTEAAIKAVKRWKYERPYFVTGLPSERQTFLWITLMKGTAPKVVEPMPAGVLGCIGIGTPTRVRILQFVMENRLLSRVEPVYPPQARTEHIEGMVVLRINIDKDGNVYRADSVSGPPVLIPAAIDAVKQWKYQPYLIAGEPTEVETSVEISFRL
jgi:TonB family protein